MKTTYRLINGILIGKTLGAMPETPAAPPWTSRWEVVWCMMNGRAWLHLGALATKPVKQ